MVWTVRAARDVAAEVAPDAAVAVAAPADGAGGAEVLRPRDAPMAVRWLEAPALEAAAIGGGGAPAVDPELPPAGWPLALPGAIASTVLPAGASPAGEGRVAPVPAAGRRIATLWALGGFAITPAHADLRVLEVRARYRDAIAVWINGVPVVRRGVVPGTSALTLAPRPHGPEWETFYVPVVPGLLRAGENLIAVEVRASRRSSAASLALEVAGRRTARVVVGPMVQRVTATSATIVVETDRPAQVDVTWSPAPDAGDERRAAPVSGDGRRHQAELAGLPADARVSYDVAVDGAVVASAGFTTAPRAGEIVRFAVYGDVRGGHDAHAALVQQVAGDAPDAVLFTGDLVLRGTDEADWQRFFSIARPLLATTPYYPAQGNHDVGTGGDRGRRFADRFALPPAPPGRPAGAAWYSFDVGGVHVVALDSNAYDLRAQRAWLEDDLAAAAGARAVLAITHDGPFSRGTHGGNPVAARDYAPILARHRVAVIFSGHDHLYQRGVARGLPYVVTGGGGAPLYPARCGVRGRPRCHGDDGMRALASQHHYVLLTVFPSGLELCARHADGTALEPCVTLPLRPAPAR